MTEPSDPAIPNSLCDRTKGLTKREIISMLLLVAGYDVGSSVKKADELIEELNKK